jgi:tight adherence protein C
MTLADLLPTGIGTDDLAVAMAALGALSAAVAVWRALLVRDPVPRRIRAVAGERAAMQAARLSPQKADKRFGGLREEGLGLMRRVIERLNLRRSEQGQTAEYRLARAGRRSRDAMVAYLFFRLSLPFAFGVLAVSAIYLLDIYPVKPALKPAICFAAVLAGYFLPVLIVKNQGDKREAALRKALPDGLDLLVICAEAGLSLDAALARVSREIAPSTSELAEELALTSAELSFLPDRRRALQNLARRCPMPELAGLVNTLIQTERYGTPLTRSLRVLSAEFRNERLMRAEAKAARLPATLTLPLILFIMPPLFIVLIGPAIIQAIDAFAKM